MKSKRFKPGDLFYDMWDVKYVGVILEECPTPCENDLVLYHSWSPVLSAEAEDISCICGKISDFQWSDEIELIHVEPTKRKLPTG